MKKLLIILGILLLAWPCWAATYYVRADGTAANKAAATGPCGTVGNCMNVTVHNGEAFSGDDVINVCDDGGNYSIGLNTPSSGTSGHEIIYTGSMTGCAVVVDGNYINLEKLIIN